MNIYVREVEWECPHPKIMAPFKNHPNRRSDSPRFEAARLRTSAAQIATVPRSYIKQFF